MKDNKALVPVLIIVIVIALAIVVWQVMARGHKEVVDDQGKDLLAPLELDPDAKMPASPTPPEGGTIGPKGG